MTDKQLEKQWWLIALDTIRAADAVDCSYDQFINGLCAIEDHLMEHRKDAEQKLAETEESTRDVC